MLVCCVPRPMTCGPIKGLGPAKRAELLGCWSWRRALRSTCGEHRCSRPRRVKGLSGAAARWPRARSSPCCSWMPSTGCCARGDVPGDPHADLGLPREVFAARWRCTPRPWCSPTAIRPASHEPSRADELLTQALEKPHCALVDVRVLDHIVVGAGGRVASRWPSEETAVSTARAPSRRARRDHGQALRTLARRERLRSAEQAARAAAPRARATPNSQLFAPLRRRRSCERWPVTSLPPHGCRQGPARARRPARAARARRTGGTDARGAVRRGGCRVAARSPTIALIVSSPGCRCRTS